jgi:tetratricopeptide (TPR) repeat protein
MFADMVGYTSLMQEDERRAKLLRDRQREVLESRVAEFEGEIIQYYGDGALCGFQSAIQAVECAVAIQIDLRDEPQVPVRIGIHLGDVAFDKTGVYGDGVNVASRIESLAVTGGVLVSGKVADELKNQRGISTEFMAEVALKNVKEPQRVFAVTNEGLAVPAPKEVKGWKKAGKVGAGAGRGWLKWAAGVVVVGAVVFAVSKALLRHGEGGPPGEVTSTPLTQESIAILPFEFHGQESDRWMAEGMALNLYNILSGGIFLPKDVGQIESLFETQAGRGMSGPRLYQAVAEEVDAELVLQGDLTAVPGGTLRASASLFQVLTQEATRPLTVEGTPEGYFDLVEGLALALFRVWSDADPSLLADLPTDNLVASKAFHEGNRQFQIGNYDPAVDLLSEAIEADPNFAIAHYRLSQAALYAWKWNLARQAVDDAWDLRSELSPLNVELLTAWRFFLRNEADRAEDAYKRLFNEYPRRPEVLAGLGSVLAYYNSLRGRSSSEAVEYFEEVLEADPNYGEARYHVLDAAAGSGDRETFDRLVGSVNPESPQVLPFAAVRAFAFGSTEDQDLIVGELEDAGTDAVVYAAARVAALLRHFPGARRLADILLRARGSGQHREAGNGLMVALAFAQGRWTETDHQLSLLAEGEMEWSREMRALFSLFLDAFSPVPVPGIELAQLRETIDSWTPGEGVEIDSYLNLFGPHAQHHPEFRLYLLGLLSAALGEMDEAWEFSPALTEYGSGRPQTAPLTHALSLSVRAHVHQARGEASQALDALEAVDYYPPFEFISVSPFFSRALDRWLRGELLLELGRPRDALPWFNTLSDGWGEFLFAGPAHLRQAQIYEEIPDTALAIEHYTEFLRLWGGADPAFEGLLREAREALNALGAGDDPAQNPPW